MRRRSPAISIFVAALAIWFVCGADAADPNKVLRFAEPNINTLDPHQYDDSFSDTICQAIFESLYEWDYLSRPTRLVPLAAEGPPEIGNGGTRWTIRIKPGIFFTDDPAFHGKPRELVAQDFVYSIKRRMDPSLRLGGLPLTTVPGLSRDAKRSSPKRNEPPPRSLPDEHHCGAAEAD